MQHASRLVASVLYPGRAAMLVCCMDYLFDCLYDLYA